MIDYSIFKRVPGSHPRWHQVSALPATSRPDALRRYGIDAPPKQACVIHDSGKAIVHLYLAWKSDEIDFDYRDLNGKTVTR